MISEQELIDAEYTKYTGASSIKKYSDFFYQKKFKDTLGTKYFIEFWHFPPVEGIVDASGRESWQPETNIYDEENSVIFEATFFNSTKSVARIEELVNKLWQIFPGYYEGGPENTIYSADDPNASWSLPK